MGFLGSQAGIDKKTSNFLQYPTFKGDFFKFSWTNHLQFRYVFLKNSDGSYLKFIQEFQTDQRFLEKVGDCGVS